jgi:peroxiredoxin
MRRLMSWLLVCAVGFCAKAVYAEDAPAGAAPVLKPKINVGEKAPDFSLRDRDGNLVRLSDFVYPGKEHPRKKRIRLLLDFFSTDCKACKAELPQVIAYQNKYQQEVRVLMIAIPESEDGQAKLDQFLAQNPVPFPVLVDGYEAVAKKYIANGSSMTLPSIFLINKYGRVRALFMGLEKDLEASLQAALAQKLKKLPSP